MRDFWFAGLAEDARVADDETTNRQFGVGMSQEEKFTLDGSCNDKFGPALRALSPDHLSLPPFESYERDLENAATISQPLFNEVSQAQSESTKKGSDTLLSLILLLDQMPRNIYRSGAGLKLVFTHYDRLAHNLLHASLKLDPNPLEHPSLYLRPAVKNWFLLPLMHSEHIRSHELFVNISQRWRQEGVEAGDKDVIAALDRPLAFEEAHIEPLRRFGRYPHRNAALGRMNTEAEERHMAKGGSSFGVQQHGGHEHAGLQDKSEL